MGNFLIKGNTDEYQHLVDTLNGCIDDMNSLKSEYHAHIGRIDEVLDQTDSNFDRLVSFAEQGVDLLGVSISNMEGRRDAVQAALDGLKEIQENTRNTLDSGLDGAKLDMDALRRLGSLLG